MQADLHKTVAPPIVELPPAGQRECRIPTHVLPRQHWPPRAFMVG
jgi:hypothetical protein